ncbi:hypothetical protein BC829DRAFT_390618 [Chytridium lagenaria]|nr:hypothetical protein BC829DRAFT_390618 [Chytridium lagenaria]
MSIDPSSYRCVLQGNALNFFGWQRAPLTIASCISQCSGRSFNNLPAKWGSVVISPDDINYQCVCATDDLLNDSTRANGCEPCLNDKKVRCGGSSDDGWTAAFYKIGSGAPPPPPPPSKPASASPIARPDVSPPPTPAVPVQQPPSLPTSPQQPPSSPIPASSFANDLPPSSQPPSNDSQQPLSLETSLAPVATQTALALNPLNNLVLTSAATIVIEPRPSIRPVPGPIGGNEPGKPSEGNLTNKGGLDGRITGLIGAMVALIVVAVVAGLVITKWRRKGSETNGESLRHENLGGSTQLPTGPTAHHTAPVSAYHPTPSKMAMPVTGPNSLSTVINSHDMTLRPDSNTNIIASASSHHTQGSRFVASLKSQIQATEVTMGSPGGTPCAHANWRNTEERGLAPQLNKEVKLDNVGVTPEIPVKVIVGSLQSSPRSATELKEIESFGPVPNRQLHAKPVNVFIGHTQLDRAGSTSSSVRVRMSLGESLPTYTPKYSEADIEKRC